MDSDAIARHQNGLITRSQALAAGMTVDAIRWRVDDGQWRRIGHGIYQVHMGPLTWMTRAQALSLRIGQDGALTLETASHLHGVLDRPPQILTAAVIGRRVERLIGTRVAKVRALDIVWRRGLPVTSAASTVLDLCATPGVQWREAVHAVARWIHQGKVTQEQITSALDARARHPLRRVITVALNPIAEGVESVLELQSLERVIRQHGLPEPRLQAPGRGASSDTRRDAEWEEFRVVLEVDGLLFHNGESIHRDRLRDRRSARDGWLTIRAGHVDVEFGPCTLAADIFCTLRSHGYRGGIRPCGPGCTVGRDLRAG